MLKRPPQHSATAPGLYVFSSDDAWDHERIDRERAGLPKDQHPVDRYFAGTTRYDVDAPETVGGVVVRVRDYFREGASPTVFRLRRAPGVERDKLSAVFGDPLKRDEQAWRLARLGLVEVTDGFDGPAWDLQGGITEMTAADMQALYDVNRALPASIGYAVYHYSAPLSEVEGKR